MKNNKLRNLLYSGVILALIFSIAVPTFATSGSDKENKRKFFQFGQSKKSVEVAEGNDVFEDGAPSFNNAFRTARDEFNSEIKAARKVYKQEKKSAHESLRASLKSASNNQDSIINAYNSYRNSLVNALEKMAKAEQAAYSKFISTLRNINLNPALNRAPVANSVSVKTNMNTLLAIALTGSDPDGCASQKYTYSIDAPVNGSLSSLSGTAICNNGQISFSTTYTPKLNVSGTESFKFRIYDGALNSNSANVSVAIAINDTNN